MSIHIPNFAYHGCDWVSTHIREDDISSYRKELTEKELAKELKFLIFLAVLMFFLLFSQTEVKMLKNIV